MSGTLASTNTIPIDILELGDYLSNQQRSVSKKIELIPTNAKTVGNGDRRAISDLNGQKSIVFETQPDNISEQGNALYSEITGIRQSSSILIYMDSPARTFNISGVLLARTVNEAILTHTTIHKLKSWRMPKFGQGGNNPPEVLLLKGYGSMFNAIPTVLTNYSFDMSTDSDLIDYGNNIILPIVTKFSISLKEAQGNADIKAFNREQFAQGILPGW